MLISFRSVSLMASAPLDEVNLTRLFEICDLEQVSDVPDKKHLCIVHDLGSC